LEIMEQLPDVDEIYVPIGGGGLAAGILSKLLNRLIEKMYPKKLKVFF